MRRALVALALLLGAGAAWLFWPEEAARGPSVTERAKQASAHDGAAVSARAIPDADLPPEGTRSLFDHLIAGNEQLPYPFDRLIALVAQQDPQGRAPVRVLIPLGRSLLKAQANFEKPRVLVAADVQPDGSEASLAPSWRGQLFLGFVENASEIEVLSYNEAAGRFEFQLVRDYCAGCVPRIVYARRAVCTTCHQGAAPIFPQRPWNETHAHPAITERMVAARGAAPAAEYLGVPLAGTLALPERFDELTEIGNSIVLAQRLWLDGCGAGEPGAACRRALLKLALRYAMDPGGFAMGAPEVAALQAAQARAFPAGGIPVSESDIRNRDPLLDTRSLRQQIRDRIRGAAEHLPGARSNEDLDAFDRLPKLPPDLDPLASRPPRRMVAAAELDGVYGIAQLFTAGDIDRLQSAAGFVYANAEAGVDALPAELFGERPFVRVQAMQALLAPGVIADARKEPPPRSVPQYCCLDTAEMSPPVAIGVPPLALAAGSVLKPFEQYCFACHRGNPARRLDFMNGATEDEVLARIRETTAIRDVLDWERYRGSDKEGTLMPPADSHQRADLEAAVARGEPVLQQMRDVVPGLFDF